MSVAFSESQSVQMLVPYLRLARTEGIGSVSFRRLLERYQTPQAALEQLPFFKQKQFRIPSEAAILKEIEGTFALSGKFLIWGQQGYPAALAGLPDAPSILTILGDATLLHKKMIAIVGARNASAHGLRIAESLSAEVASHQIGIISGLARGIDQAAHRGALFTSFTIAAIAGGIDKPYPQENAALQAQIAKQGVIITESPLGSAPKAIHFPRRNRLIAGLCWGCVVIEAALHSGSLITAQLALNYGKTVFAVPGSPLDPRNRGSNNLLRMGAVFTESAEDILSELPLEPPIKSVDKPITADDFPLFKVESQSPKAVNEDKHATTLEEIILGILSFTPTPIDEIVRSCNVSTAKVLSCLTELELSGRILSQPTGYCLAPH